ncbi:MAG: ABC transporter ATP-binding protein [Candidatus Dormibacteria bacterium]
MIAHPEPGRGPVPRPEGGRLKGAIEAIRGTARAFPRVLSLVWNASRPLTLLLAVATILAGVIPAIQAYAAKLLVNAVVHAILVHAGQAADASRLEVPFLWMHLRGPVMTSVGIVVALAAAQFVIFAVISLLQTLSNISQQLLQERMSITVQLMIMQRAAELDLEFFEDPTSYDILQQAQNQAVSRPVQMVSGSFGLLRTTLTFLSMAALLVGVSPLLAVVALLAPIPSFISDSRYGWRGFAIARWRSPLRRRMTYLLNLLTLDTTTKEVKLFTLSRHIIARFRDLSEGYYGEQRDLVTRRYLSGFAWGTLSTLAGSGTYLYVALQAVAGRLTLGDLTLYTQAATSVQSSFQGILSGFSGMYENNLYLTSLFELLGREASIKAPEHPVPVPIPLRGRIEFEDVSFAYRGAATPALEGISFVIEPGETIAIVGRNGAGKTTLTKLMGRLYDTTAGRVLVDGVDIRDYDPEELRAQVGVLFQDYVNYQFTAGENVGLGSVDRIEDRAAVAEAASQSGAAAVIEKLPRGYDTMLGKWFDEGVNLSGGEWQKVALARAFMRDARILILDEPTAALDAQAEFELFQRLRALTRERTAIFISHRFSTVRQADRILVLEDGHLVEQGSHHELMSLDGRYSRLFRLQAAAYTGSIDEIEEAAEAVSRI